jgi:hypothetical protein
VSKRPYTEMVYQPMLEVLTNLRDNGFKTFIVSGGGIDFMRPWSETVYGIPPEQVVGSSGKTEFLIRDGVPVLRRLPEVDFIDDKAGKPVGIHEHIGRRPIAAFGNSDGDLEMLQWAGGGGRRFALVVHHTDDPRMGPRPQGLYRPSRQVARRSQGQWLDCRRQKDDWKMVFPFGDKRD